MMLPVEARCRCWQDPDKNAGSKTQMKPIRIIVISDNFGLKNVCLSFLCTRAIGYFFVKDFLSAFLYSLQLLSFLFKLKIKNLKSQETKNFHNNNYKFNGQIFIPGYTQR